MILAPCISVYYKNRPIEFKLFVIRKEQFRKRRNFKSVLLFEILYFHFKYVDFLIFCINVSHEIMTLLLFFIEIMILKTIRLKLNYVHINLSSIVVNLTLTSISLCVH